ncbi:DUF2946 domain-containing protein [Dyella solisilvae]|uniref:DUF2946 domain-containing protein n=1 Tax=Dyella solisilvae TaxID=1920168 RepID=A0A370K947_9GAMM|nr:DUF2946 domain-containing protein [Dyella solisilvae]
MIAWLAIAAMGLLALVPTVSRVLESPVALHVMAMDMDMAMGADCPEQHASQDHRHAPPDSGQLPSTDACGYCSLISHSPALMAAALVLPPALPAASPAITRVAPDAPSVAPLDVHSRGPPLV